MVAFWFQSLGEVMNIPAPEMRDQVDPLLAAIRPPSTHFRMRCGAVLDRNEWRNALCVIDPAPDGQGTDSEVVRYPNVRLLRDFARAGELRELLDNIDEGRLTVAGEHVHVQSPGRFWTRMYLPGQNAFSARPGTLFSYQAERPNLQSQLQRPLLAHESPYYPEGWTAIAELTGISEFGPSGSVDLGGVLLFVPEMRARFDRLEFADGHLRFTLAGVEALRPELVVRGAWRVESDEWTSFEARASGDVAQVAAPDTVVELGAYLIGPDDAVLDFHRQGRGRHSGHAPIAFPSGRENTLAGQVRRAVQAGEGSEIEFKPYIEPRHPKIREVVETSIAFANSHGGLILIGIDDRCAVVGIDAGIRQHRKKSGQTRTEAEENYVGWIRQTIRGAMAATVNVEIEIVDLNGRSVVAVGVPEGQEKPYHNQVSKEILIRRGASNARPDPVTELPNLYAKGLSMFQPPSVMR